MFSKLLPVLSLLLTLLTFATAEPADMDLEAPANLDLETRQSSDYVWRISQFNAECANGVCDYQIVIRGRANGDIPRFMATCVAEGVPRASREFRNCSVNRGEGIQNVKAFVELRPRRPNVTTRMVIEMSYNDVADGGSTVTYYRGRQDGTYRTFRDLSQRGNFDIVPLKTAAVAK